MDINLATGFGKVILKVFMSLLNHHGNVFAEIFDGKAQLDEPGWEMIFMRRVRLGATTQINLPYLTPTLPNAQDEVIARALALSLIISILNSLLLLFHKDMMRGVVYNLLAKHRGSHHPVSLGGRDGVDFAVESKMVTIGTKADGYATADQLVREAVAILFLAILQEVDGITVGKEEVSVGVRQIDDETSHRVDKQGR